MAWHDMCAGDLPQLAIVFASVKGTLLLSRVRMVENLELSTYLPGTETIANDSCDRMWVSCLASQNVKL